MYLVEKEKLLLLAEKAELESKAAPILERIKQIDTLLNSENKINWNEKVMHCLDVIKEPLTTEEILSYVFYKKERVIENRKDRRKFVLKISLSLVRLRDVGIVYSESVDGYRGNIYGFTEWKQSPEHKLILDRKKQTLIENNLRFHYY